MKKDFIKIILIALLVNLLLNLSAQGAIDSVYLFTTKQQARSHGCDAKSLVYTFDGARNFPRVHNAFGQSTWTPSSEPQSWYSPGGHQIGYMEAKNNLAQIGKKQAYGYLEKDTVYCFFTYQLYQGEEYPRWVWHENCPYGRKCACVMTSNASGGTTTPVANHHCVIPTHVIST